VDPDVTYLELQRKDGKPFKSVPGQYCFICVPKISRVEWHPFTIVSPRSCSEKPSFSTSFAFCVRDQGSKTFTGKLFKAATNLKTNSHPQVLVDGPFGFPGVCIREYRRVLLVAGGIGVTPVTALVQDLLDKPPSKMHVTMVWVVRKEHHFKWFEPLLKQILRSKTQGFRVELNLFLSNSRAKLSGNNPRSPGTSKVNPAVKENGPEKLHITQNCGPEPNDAPLTHAHEIGRPNWDKILSGMINEDGDETAWSHAAVFVCGPPGLKNSLHSALATPKIARQSRRFDIHEETFLL